MHISSSTLTVTPGGTHIAWIVPYSNGVRRRNHLSFIVVISFNPAPYLSKSGRCESVHLISHKYSPFVSYYSVKPSLMTE